MGNTLNKVYGTQKTLGDLGHWLCYQKILDEYRYPSRRLTCQEEMLEGPRSIYSGCHGIILLLVLRAEINTSSGLLKLTPTLCCFLTSFCLKNIRYIWKSYPLPSTDEVIIPVFPKCFIFVSDIKWCVFVISCVWLALHTYPFHSHLRSVTTLFTIFWLSVQMKAIPSKICHEAGSQRTADIKHKSLSVRAMA